MRDNFILDTDSYKTSHFLQYPPDTVGMYSYLEAREGAKYPYTIFFGLQYLLKRYFTEVRFDVAEAEEFYTAHGVPFNAKGFRRLKEKYPGTLPLEIHAVPEGMNVPVGNVLMTVESTDPEFFWLVNYLETMFVRLWYPITVATVSHYCKGIIRRYLDLSSDNPETEILFKLHDFGSRGVSSRESAAIGGAAHLVNFMGSDTVVGVRLANEYYDAKMAAFSIPAAEHSTITSWGREHEVDAYRNMLHRFAKPGSLVAVVSDSYDLYNAVEHIWGETLRQEVIDSGATIVIRPDSGDPKEVVLKTLYLLHEKFGGVTNAKGYRVLNNVRVIQGDGVDPESIKDILEHITEHCFSATNLAFGMGGALLQKVDRDTQRFAFKCSQITVEKKEGRSIYRPVFKSPKTDVTKSSKAGRLHLVRDMGRLRTLTTREFMMADPTPVNELKLVYLDGSLLATSTLDEIRALSAK